MSIDEVIEAFLEKIKKGPVYVCTVCHRLMYKESVYLCNKDKNVKASAEVLACVFNTKFEYNSFDHKMWVCTNCDKALLRGNIPLQSKANGFSLPEVPPELSSLNMLERRLISLHIPFMKMVALPVGKQRHIHEPAINVLSNLDFVCTVLPRLPSESELIPLKLKQKLSYKGHYMYDYINPTKVLNALKWLKINNILYKDITINSNWVESSIVESNLICSLMPQNFSSESHETSDDDSCLDNSDSHDDSFGGLSQIAKHHGFIVHDVPGDGDCLFSAITCQLEPIGISNINKHALRHQVVSYLAENSTRFRDYVLQPVQSANPCNADTEPPTTEDDYIATVGDPDLQTEPRWQRYLKRLQNGAWGDHVALQGMCEMLNISAHILSTQNLVMVDIVPSTGKSVGDVHIGLIIEEIISKL